ncbi:AhpC/TSA antioxidant enzyme-domain-containing protein, partial [Crucibulum laeve]
VATLPIIDETGRTLPFGSLFASQRAIVVFIRHFWCPLCQDYLSSVTSLVRPELLSYDGEKRKSMQLVVIGNGAPGLIKKYRQMIGLPFNMYSDPTLAIYSALGMESKSTVVVRRDRGYVKHGSMAGIAVAFVRAIKVGMPVWEKGGNVAQLGGEFVLGPGLTCLYAHRMQSSKGHAPIQD